MKKAHCARPPAGFERGRFRLDLYHRLDVFHIRVPPLRDRREDILPLASHFLSRFAARMRKPVARFSPETERVLGLGGVELVCIGYNTPVHNPPAPEHDRYGDFHNHLVMQAGAYQNGTFVVGVAKAGVEEGVDHIGGTCVIHPSGTIVARTVGLGDELAVAACDLDDTVSYKTTVFDFARHRQPDTYGPLVDPP